MQIGDRIDLILDQVEILLEGISNSFFPLVAATIRERYSAIRVDQRIDFFPLLSCESIRITDDKIFRFHARGLIRSGEPGHSIEQGETQS